jgi:hypothetical protein
MKNNKNSSLILIFLALSKAAGYNPQAVLFGVLRGR